MKIEIGKELKNIKFYLDSEGKKMPTAHPALIVKVSSETEFFYLAFNFSSNTQDLGIRMKRRDGSIYNAYVKTEALVRTKIKSIEEMRKAINYYMAKGQRRIAENISLGSVVEFYDDDHITEFNKNVPVFFSKRDFVETSAYINADMKEIYKKIAFFLEKNAFNFYLSPNMYGKENEEVKGISLKEETIKNLIFELKKKSV